MLFRLHIKLQHLPGFVCFRFCCCFFLVAKRVAFSARIKWFQFVSLLWKKREQLKNRQKHTARDKEIEKNEGKDEVMREVQATTDIFVRALVHKTHS